MTRNQGNKPRRTGGRSAQRPPCRSERSAQREVGKAKSPATPRGAGRPGRCEHGGGAHPPRRPEWSARCEAEGALAGRPFGPSGCALCPVFGRCGGCSQLDISYAEQLAAKQRTVADLFADLAPAEVLLPILGMEDPFHYRNKVISPYAPAKGRGGKRLGADRRAKAMPLPLEHGKATGAAKAKAGKAARPRLTRADILTGMYAPGTHRLVPTDACAIENETAKRVTLAIRDIMARWGMEPYDEDAGEGFVRHAVVRVGHESGEVLVTVVTNGDEFPSAKAFCRELVKRVPAITTIVQNVNTRSTNVILGERERVLFGPGFILDTLCGLSFRISSQSFYQVNATQTEVLYDEAIRLANLTGAETVIDAYCGTGTIGLVAAKRGAARVIGVDSVDSSIRDAANNARHNGVENAEFVVRDATEFMEELAAGRAAPGQAPEGCPTEERGMPLQGLSHHGGEAHPPCHPERSAQRGIEGSPAGREPLVLLMDPPRAGSTPQFLEAACRLAPKRIVYISCNPTTQARDVRHLVAGGYAVRAIRPVDMFPHTDHVESIVMLEKK